MKTQAFQVFPNTVIALTSVTQFEDIFQNTITASHQTELSGSSYWWLVYCRLGYYLKVSPIKIVQNKSGNDELFAIHIPKGQRIISSFMILSCFAYFVWKLQLLLSCTMDGNVYLRLIDQLPDISKLFAITYMCLARQDQVLGVINSGMKSHLRKFADGSKFSIIRNKKKFCTSIFLGGYIAYAFVSKLVNDLAVTWDRISLDYETLSDTHDSPCTGGATNDTALRRAVLLAMLFPQQIHMFYVHLADLLVISTVAMYCEMVDEATTKLRSLSTDSHLQTNSKLAFQAISEFQDQIERINSSVQDVLLVCVVADLPYYVLRAIPSILFIQSFTHVKLRRCLYVAGFFGSFLAAGIKYEKLQDAIRQWISKASILEDANPKRFQQLVWDLESNRNFAIGLNGFGNFNISLFMSIVSVTVTYTVIYYQFQKPN